MNEDLAAASETPKCFRENGSRLLQFYSTQEGKPHLNLTLRVKMLTNNF